MPFYSQTPQEVDRILVELELACHDPEKGYNADALGNYQHAIEEYEKLGYAVHWHQEALEAMASMVEYERKHKGFSKFLMGQVERLIEEEEKRKR